MQPTTRNPKRLLRHYQDVKEIDRGRRTPWRALLPLLVGLALAPPSWASAQTREVAVLAGGTAMRAELVQPFVEALTTDGTSVRPLEQVTLLAGSLFGHDGTARPSAAEARALSFAIGVDELVLVWASAGAAGDVDLVLAVFPSGSEWSARVSASAAPGALVGLLRDARAAEPPSAPALSPSAPLAAASAPSAAPAAATEESRATIEPLTSVIREQNLVARSPAGGWDGGRRVSGWEPVIVFASLAVVSAVAALAGIPLLQNDDGDADFWAGFGLVVGGSTFFLSFGLVALTTLPMAGPQSGPAERSGARFGAADGGALNLRGAF